MLTPWLRLANKSTRKPCLLAMDVWQIGLYDTTIVPQMADKSAELIMHARHEWPIKRSQDYEPWKDEK